MCTGGRSVGTLPRDNLTLYRATMHKRQEFLVEDEFAGRANRMLIGVGERTHKYRVVEYPAAST